MKRGLWLGAFCLVFSLFGIPAAAGENRGIFIIGFGLFLVWALSRAVSTAIGEAADPEDFEPTMVDPNAPAPARSRSLVEIVRSHLPGRLKGEPRIEPPLTEIESLERTMTASLRSWSDAEQLLVPLLRRVAADRLRIERGVYLRQEPDKARAVLGEDAWPFYAPAHTAARTRDAAITPQEIDVALRALEELS